MTSSTPSGSPSSAPGGLAASQVAAQPAAARAALRTLLVEDDPLIRGLLEMALSLRGLDVTARGDGQQAWELWRSERFPLIVLDWMLPGLDGLELCRRIRASPSGDEPVVVAVTARTRPEDLRAMLAAGANDYLPKPFELAAFDLRLAVAEQQVRRIAERRQTALLDRDRNEVLELVARNEPLGEVLVRLALLVERQCPEARCAVLLARDGRLFHAAAPGLPERFVAALDGRELGATIDDRGETVIAEDIAADPRWVDRRELAVAHGLRACWSVPIVAGLGQVLGVLVLYHRRPRRPTEQDLALLEACARLAALAVEHARLFDQAATVEALQALARLKSEFLSTVSHELRTPLSLVYGYAELLEVRAPSLSAEQVAEMASEIHTSSGTMIRLVDDLLDFARIEQGRLRLERRRIDTVELFGHLAETFSHQPGGRRIVAELPEHLEATVDPERLSQIVSNLLSNALRYAPAGPILLRVAQQKDGLRIEVADQGPGIPLEEQSRVWERFYRGADAINSATRGSGLGLAVVKHLVELQGGRVGLRSAPGQGTTFWLTLPEAS